LQISELLEHVQGFCGFLFVDDAHRETDVHQDPGADQIIEPDPVDQTTLTERYTEAAVAFIESPRRRPFFVYLAHSFPHIPLHASKAHAGESAAGLYGDVVEDLDRSMGAIVAALERSRAADNTLVVVTSDNPRHEAPEAIISGIVSGMTTIPELVETDRRAAIRHALAGASAGDVVVIAGKGHEDTQTVGEDVIAFDDREVAREELHRLGGQAS